MVVFVAVGKGGRVTVHVKVVAVVGKRMGVLLAEECDGKGLGCVVVVGGVRGSAMVMTVG